MSGMVKTVPIELDRTRHMRLTLGDCRAFRRATTTESRPEGISLIRGDLGRVELSEDDWLALFHVCLHHEDPELTVDGLADLIDVGGFVRAGEALQELLADFSATGGASAEPDPTTSAGAVPRESSGSSPSDTSA